MEDIFIQKMTISKGGGEPQEVDLSWLVSSTIIETLDLSGPRIKLIMRDPYGLLRDDMELDREDVLTVQCADSFGEDGMDAVFRFTVATSPADTNLVKVEGFLSAVRELKRPATRARLFNAMPVKSILADLVPGATGFDVGAFPASTYHLLPSCRPSKLIRQMAHELGAVAFFRRGGIFVFKSLAEILAVESVETFSYRNPSAGFPIVSYSSPNDGGLTEDMALRRYVGWGITSGPIRGRAPAAAFAPEEFSSGGSEATMDALIQIPIVAIDFIASGHGAITSGVPVDLRMHTLRTDSPLDESVPPKVVVGVVAHHYQSQKYAIRVRGVLPL